MARALSSRGATVIVGFMGAGKTTAARALATARRTSAIDADRLIEDRLGCTIRQAFERDGEAAFRAVEESVVAELLDRSLPDQIISLSGGAVTSERVRKKLGRHLVAWIDVDVAHAWRRSAGGKRPLARDRSAFEALYRERRSLYESVADAILPAAARYAVPRAYDALESARLAPAGTRLLWAVSESAEYPVWVGRELLGAGVWPIARPPSRRFLITDEHVAPLWSGRLGDLDGRLQIAAGESNKTLASAEAVWRGLAAAGVTRSDHLVALGGGVVGDLTGFCAATYQRGVPVVQVPTTLVAQVDSAFGGKTGVDIPEAKNYVGVYHQPAGVLVDPATLDTLPAVELNAGYAEVLKTALIAGGELWEWIAADAPIDQRLIIECIRCKLGVVAGDERDSGTRQTLNLGHTVGHAIESVTGYSRYRHGEALALGLLVALRLSGLDDLRERVAGLLAAHGLPTAATGIDVDAVLAATKLDKKRGPKGVPMVLVAEPGRVRHGADVDDADLELAVREVLT
ncbi:MAG: bifunctional shikimate kinase/3-dehydroquinate synthase [Solirubrobacteraceae bacterium]|jgi:shikimate kinase/3-dehydroquinate synthase